MTENTETFDGYSLHLVMPSNDTIRKNYDTVFGFYDTLERAIDEAIKCHTRDNDKGITRYGYYVAGFSIKNFRNVNSGGLISYGANKKLFSTGIKK